MVYLKGSDEVSQFPAFAGVKLILQSLYHLSFPALAGVHLYQSQ